MLQPKPKQNDSLAPEKREQLDGNIKSMLANGATEEDVHTYVDEFKSKFGLKKKDSFDSPNSQTVGQSELDPPTSDTTEPTILEKGVDYAKTLFKLRKGQAADALEHLKAGAAETVAGIAGIPNFIGKSMFTAFADDEQLEFLNSLPPEQREDFINNAISPGGAIMGSGSISASADAQNYMTELSEEIRSKTIQYEGNIVDNLNPKKPNIDAAVGQIVNGIAESIPSLVLAAAPGGLITIGAGSASQKQESLEREGENLDANSILNSAISGTAEGVFERVTAGLLKPIKGVFKGNKELVKDFSENFTVNILKSMGLEGSSEALTTITQQLSDDLFKNNEMTVTTANFWKNVADAALIGGIVGGNISVANIAANRIMGDGEKSEIKDIDNKISKLDSQEGQPLPENIRKELNDTKELLIKAKEEKVQSAYDKFLALPKEKRQALGDTESKLNAIKAEYDAIKSNENLDQETKDLLLERKSAEAESLLKEKESILEEPKEEENSLENQEQEILPEQNQEEIEPKNLENVQEQIQGQEPNEEQAQEEGLQEIQQEEVGSKTFLAKQKPPRIKFKPIPNKEVMKKSNAVDFKVKQNELKSEVVNFNKLIKCIWS